MKVFVDGRVSKREAGRERGRDIQERREGGRDIQGRRERGRDIQGRREERRNEWGGGHRHTTRGGSQLAIAAWWTSAPGL